jgi:hypothetical protein
MLLQLEWPVPVFSDKTMPSVILSCIEGTVPKAHSYTSDKHDYPG